MLEMNYVRTWIGDHVDDIETWQNQYKMEGYVEIPQFLPTTFMQVYGELEECFAQKAARKDITVAQHDNSRRVLTGLSQDVIEAECPTVKQLYDNVCILGMLSAILGESVIPVPYIPEKYVASRLHTPGDVHGWHWDDYAFAAVWVLESPALENGGHLEFVRNAPWVRSKPDIVNIVNNGPVVKRYPAKGSLYLLRAGASLHRVAELVKPDERMILCMAYASCADNFDNVNHSSMEQLYPASSK